MHLRTQRLFLREARLEDADAFFALDRDPEVMRFVGGVSSEATMARSQRRMGELISGYRRQPGLGVWPCLTCAEEGFIGWFMLRSKHIWLAGDPKEEHRMELGYRLSAAAWGKGYATEMSRALVRYAFDQLGLTEVWAIAHPENQRSIRVLLKAGLEFRGLGSYPHEAPVDNVYSIHRGQTSG